MRNRIYKWVGAWHLVGHHPSHQCSQGQIPQLVAPPSLLNITHSRVNDSYKGA
jgi:hypothetical protein